MTEKTIKWADAPTDDDRADASRFLTLFGGPQARLENSGQVFHPAKDLLRAARLPALPQNNKGVAKWRERIEEGEVVPPVLLVRGDLVIDVPLVIAEGYHRVSACYLLGEATPVAGHFLTQA